MNKQLAYKYLKLLLTTVLLVNVLQFIFKLFSLKDKLDFSVFDNPILGEWVTLIGFFYCILILTDKSKFEGVSNLVLFGILLMTFLSYYTGVTFLILFLILSPLSKQTDK